MTILDKRIAIYLATLNSRTPEEAFPSGDDEDVNPEVEVRIREIDAGPFEEVVGDTPEEEAVDDVERHPNGDMDTWELRTLVIQCSNEPVRVPDTLYFFGQPL